MSSSKTAYLRDTQALGQLGIALSKFAVSIQEAMSQTDAEILRTQDWLQDRARYWHRQVVQAQQEVQLAQQALRRCQNSVERDRNGRPIPPDCSAEQVHLSACRRKLQQAEMELQTVKRWQAKIEQAIGQYQKSAKIMRDVATTGKQEGQHFLSQKIVEIEKYELIHNFSSTNIFASFNVQGPYSHLENASSVGPGEDFTPDQKAKIIAVNKSRNGGVVKSDLSGIVLVPPQKCARGVVPASNEWQIDHIIPRSIGSSNSFSNAQVLSREENRAKSDK